MSSTIQVNAARKEGHACIEPTDTSCDLLIWSAKGYLSEQGSVARRIVSVSPINCSPKSFHDNRNLLFKLLLVLVLGIQLGVEELENQLEVLLARGLEGFGGNRVRVAGTKEEVDKRPDSVCLPGLVADRSRFLGYHGLGKGSRRRTRRKRARPTATRKSIQRFGFREGSRVGRVQRRRTGSRPGSLFAFPPDRRRRPTALPFRP